jgi:signal transduction histidine kinase
MVRADGRKMKQVLLNLLSNALKFPGGRRSKFGLLFATTADLGHRYRSGHFCRIRRRCSRVQQVGTASKKVENRTALLSTQVH